MSISKRTLSELDRTFTTARCATTHVMRRLRPRGERGDVPGWVLVTLMTAGLVAALWAVAEGQLTALFSAALASARR
ncbi:hypothetical protein [Pedococcus sp.]|jgi:hypothetical protein|uniref:hypothetical protein n=1 Tax=Pedococcus sp. TaxID=2860345 RepID=UPI002E157745|nr:hypothetical protein [Pedococcus sp.]